MVVLNNSVLTKIFSVIKAGESESELHPVAWTILACNHVLIVGVQIKDVRQTFAIPHGCKYVQQ